MTSTEKPADTSPPPPNRRRSSFAELFASRPNPDAGRPQPSAMSAAMAQQAQEQSRTRRLSITTLGLSGTSSMQTGTPFSTLRQARKDNGPGSVDGESAIEEDAVPPMGSENGDRRSSGQASPLGRRLSMGAKAYRDARSSSVAMPSGSNGSGQDAAIYGSSAPAKPASPPLKATGMSFTNASNTTEGFSWSDSIRNRAERASISAASGVSLASLSGHSRTKSQSVSEVPAKAAAPIPARPVPVEPDHFQERLLKGDFYMD